MSEKVGLILSGLFISPTFFTENLTFIYQYFILEFDETLPVVTEFERRFRIKY